MASETTARCLKCMAVFTHTNTVKTSLCKSCIDVSFCLECASIVRYPGSMYCGLTKCDKCKTCSNLVTDGRDKCRKCRPPDCLNCSKPCEYNTLQLRYEAWCDTRCKLSFCCLCKRRPRVYNINGDYLQDTCGSMDCERKRLSIKCTTLNCSHPKEYNFDKDIHHAWCYVCAKRTKVLRRRSSTRYYKNRTYTRRHERSLSPGRRSRNRSRSPCNIKHETDNHISM